LLARPFVARRPALALISIGLAGCSGDMSTRLSQELVLQSLCFPPEAIGTVPARRDRAP